MRKVPVESMILIMFLEFLSLHVRTTNQVETMASRSNMMANHSNIIPFNKQLGKDILASPGMLYVTIIAHLFIMGANDRYHSLKQTNTSFER